MTTKQETRRARASELVAEVEAVVPTVVHVADGTVREQRFASGDVVRRVRGRLVSGSLVMPVEASPPSDERGMSIPAGWYAIEPDDVRVSEYGAPRIARDCRLRALTQAWVDELQALVS